MKCHFCSSKEKLNSKKIKLKLHAFNVVKMEKLLLQEHKTLFYKLLLILIVID